ncbi:hypothetical protein ACHAXT_002326 [Thalassiosira profunda]
MRCFRPLKFIAVVLHRSSSFILRTTRVRASDPSAIKMARSSDTSCDGLTSLTPYDELLCRLYTTNLFNAKNCGLENMERLHEALGYPLEQKGGVSIIHIAGSNGKGSTALKIAHALKLASYSVGLFTSPHISSFRERIQINEDPASEAQIKSGLKEIFDICDAQCIPATFFEVVTALAFKIFADAKVDMVVLETGLGGRLDATNVVKQPALAVITSIGLEHTQILGDTVEQIAMEKAGIIKQGCPVLVGKNVPVEVLRECASEKQASQFYECDDVLGTEAEKPGADYDVENSRTAMAALTLLKKNGVAERLTTELIEEGIGVRPKCRFEELDIAPSNGASAVRVVLDVAHNPQALEYLVEKLRSNYPTSVLRIVAGLSADKDVKGCSDILLGNVPHPKNLHLVEASNPRAATANPKLNECHRKHPSIAFQVKEALELAASNGELLVICGSFFIMADARKQLGIDEPRDSAAIGKETARIIESRKA